MGWISSCTVVLIESSYQTLLHSPTKSVWIIWSYNTKILRPSSSGFADIAQGISSNAQRTSKILSHNLIVFWSHSIDNNHLSTKTHLFAKRSMFRAFSQSRTTSP